MANDDTPGEKPWFHRLAHDLRNPLTSLQTAAYLMRTDPGGANTRELSEIVVRQAQRMGKMIDELDDWSRAQRQRLVDRNERVDLAGAVDMAVGSLHGCTIDPHYTNGADEASVFGDAGRLSQLFRSLCEQVMARDAQGRLDVTRNGGTVELVFSDNGPALDATARARLLEAPQVPPPDDGLGLRFLIAKSIVDGHDGSIAIEGPHDGATQRIRVTLPLA